MFVFLTLRVFFVFIIFDFFDLLFLPNNADTSLELEPQLDLLSFALVFLCQDTQVLGRLWVEICVKLIQRIKSHRHVLVNKVAIVRL